MNFRLFKDYQFPQLKNLKKLDVSENGLEEVKTTAFTYLPNIEDIDLRFLYIIVWEGSMNYKLNCYPKF